MSKSVRFGGERENWPKPSSNSLKEAKAKPVRPISRSGSVYSTASPFPQIQPQALLKKVFDQPLSIVTIGELICHLPVLQDLIFGNKSKAKDQALKVASIRIGERIDKKLYAIATPKLKVKLNKEILV